MSSIYKARRRQECLKIQYSLLKGTLSVLPLLPFESLTCLNLLAQPLEVTLCVTAAFLVLDVCVFRCLFLEDLCPRKGQAGNRNAAWSFPTAYLWLLGSAVVLFVGIILFGASITQSLPETLVLAILLAVTTFGPFCHAFVDPVDEFIKLLQTEKGAFLTLDKACLVTGLMALVGAWGGSVVIPLDWDRPWQKWPIPCCFGALLGYAVSNFIWTIVLVGRFFRRSFSSKSTSKGE